MEHKLVVCIHLDEVISFLSQKAESTETKEFRSMIKAPLDNYEAIEKSIKFNHNYRLPQIIRLDITAGLSEYID